MFSPSCVAPHSDMTMQLILSLVFVFMFASFILLVIYVCSPCIHDHAARKLTLNADVK